MILFYFTYSVKVAAAVLAVMLARQHRDHRPVAAFMVLNTIADLGRTALAWLVFEPTRATVRAAGLDPAVVPFEGWTRAAFVLENALWLTWPAGLAALCLWAFTGRSRLPVVAVFWAVAVAALAIVYPRNETLGRAYTGLLYAALAVCLAAAIPWLARLKLLDRRRLPAESAPTITIPQLCAAVILAAELSLIIVGPNRWGIFKAWPLAQVVYSVLYVSLIVLHLGAMSRAR